MEKTNGEINAENKPVNKGNREIRINRLASKKAAHDLKLRQEIRDKKRRHVLRRKDRKRPGELADIIAYDLETSRIKDGTPDVKYITAYSDHHEFILSTRIDSLPELLAVVKKHLLIERFNNCKFVAWNANNFDVYFIAMALMLNDDYVIRPYLTKSKALRGIRIIVKADLELKPKQQKSWEFVDGISMLGLQGKSLKDFLKTFAPEYQKHERESFETKEFDANDPDEIAYAFRDSEGLYWGMQYAQEIVFERFNMGLRTTIGNLGIKIFESRIPEETRIVEPNRTVLKILRDYVCRGGYCHLMRKYKGPVWKYDLNQAYAAAMRETKLPAGDCARLVRKPKYSDCYLARISATNPKNTIPFYCRSVSAGRINADFALTEIVDSWITSSELEQLESEGWKIQHHEFWAWYETFDMTNFVDALEHMRSNAAGGPSGATGTMVKSIGTNSYGKTLESLEPLELVLAKECPAGYTNYYGHEEPEMMPYVWCRLIETPTKKYHQPQIGAFITAHVRMVVRRAALLSPGHFLYADTDCVIFSTDVTKQLDIDPRRYGAFKLEESGTEFILIAKKVYASTDFKTKHSKGLNVKSLDFSDFMQWFGGVVPTQTQAQRQNFVKVLKGSKMFVNRTRRGTAV